MRVSVSKVVVPLLLRDYNLLLSMHYSATTGQTALRFLSRLPFRRCQRERSKGYGGSFRWRWRRIILKIRKLDVCIPLSTYSEYETEHFMISNFLSLHGHWP